MRKNNELLKNAGSQVPHSNTALLPHTPPWKISSLRPFSLTLLPIKYPRYRPSPSHSSLENIPPFSLTLLPGKYPRYGPDYTALLPHTPP